MRGRRCAKAVPERNATEHSLARRLRGKPRQLPSGRRRGSARGYYDPSPGAGSRWSWGLRRTDARPGMGRYRSPAARELTHDPRKARPDAVNLPRMSAQSAARDFRANAAMERRKARRPRYGRSSLARTCRRWAPSRDGPRVRPDYAHQRLPALHPPRFFGGDEKGRRRQPARHSTRAAQRWLAQSFRGHNHRTREWSADGATTKGSWLWIPGPALTRRPGMTTAEETGHCHFPTLAPCPPLVDSRSAHATRTIRALFS